MRELSVIRLLFSSILLSGICLSAFPQAEEQPSITIRGTVLDASTKLPINGASITVPGFSSTFTDSLGAFTIIVPDRESTLQITGPDYQSKEVPLKGRDQLSISMYEQGYKSQNEPAYLYYTTKPLAYTTRSVVSVHTTDLNWKQPCTSSEQLFHNNVPGLRMLPASGVPGIGSFLFLRGFSSVYSSNRPVIIVDGLVFEIPDYSTPIISGFRINPLNSISVNDIENITVIRDAASIYGSRASNGVIYITTNQPGEMATKIDFSMYGGMNYSPRYIPLLKSDDYRRYLSEILQTSGISPDSLQSLPFMNDDVSFSEYYRYHNETNWQDEIYKNSINQNVNLKITGGDEIALYALSVGYQKNEGIIKETDYSKYSFRFNSDINISPKLKMKTNLGFTFNQHNLKDDGEAPKTNPIHLSLIKAPFLYPKIRSSTGSISPIFEDEDIFGISNPSAIIENMSATSNNYKILGSVDVGYGISSYFSIKNFLGINFDKTRDNVFVPYLGVAPDTLENGVAGNRIAHDVERYFNIYNDFRLNYVRTFGWEHHVNALAGARLGINKAQGDWGYDYNTPNDEIRSLGSGISSMRKVGGYFGDWNWVTFYAQAEYDFSHKYLLTINLAFDGSSRFGKEAEGLDMLGGTFGVFPSAAVAWLISSEPFMAGADMIDLLKLRLSYGITGNDNIGNYNAYKFYKSQNFLGSQGLVRGNLWNPGIQWETNKKLNGGIDLAILDERLSLSADLYLNRTEDMINFIDANPLSGFDNYIDNSGAFTSTGVDMSLNARIINSRLKWDVGFLLAKYRTKIVEFPEDKRITTYYGANILTETGKPINLFYGYKSLGVFSSQEDATASGLRALMPNTDLIPFNAGDVIFEDYNDDKVIDENDMQVIGDPNPDINGMATTTLSWKGITLDAGLSFSYGNDIYNHLRYSLESMQSADNQTPSVLNRWREEGQQTDMPRAYWGDPMGNSRFSDRWIENGSYLRLSYISLSYQIPLRLGFINKLEVFASGQNLFTLTSYLGMDPDFSLSGYALSQGIDIGLTPQVRSVYLGLKIGL
jgi:TonB-linked SusC/RagA family outer membrane protein